MQVIHQKMYLILQRDAVIFVSCLLKKTTKNCDFVKTDKKTEPSVELCSSEFTAETCLKFKQVTEMWPLPV